MTDHHADDLLLDGFPLPDDAIVVPLEAVAQFPDDDDEPRALRRLVLAALRLELQQRLLDLPLGPTLDPEDPSRLLSLNRFAVQLAVMGLASDQVCFALEPWRHTETAPQLLLAAAVDDELRIVHIPGVLSAAEVAAALPGCNPDADWLQLPVAAFTGGLERLLTLVLLVSPSALPRRALVPLAPALVLEQVIDWCRGELSAAFDALGATLLPVGAAAFRQGGDSDLPAAALAIVAIPLGLAATGEIRTGEQALRCIERFRLLLIPSGESVPDQLNLRLQAEPVGDLLPEGIVLSIAQGGRRQSLVTADSTMLELRLPADVAPIHITITPPAGDSLDLPAVQLQPT